MFFVIDAVDVVVVVIVAIGLYVIEVVVVVRFGFCCSIENVNIGREERRGGNGTAENGERGRSAQSWSGVPETQSSKVLSTNR